MKKFATSHRLFEEKNKGVYHPNPIFTAVRGEVSLEMYLSKDPKEGIHLVEFHPSRYNIWIIAATETVKTEPVYPLQNSLPFTPDQEGYEHGLQS